MLDRFRSKKSSTTRPVAPQTKPRWKPGVEALEDRLTPTVSAITSNFNGTAIAAGNYLWFNSVAKVSGVSTPTTISVTDATVSFTANGTPYTLDVPDTQVTLTPGSTAKGVTSFTDADGWTVTGPSSFSGNVFLSGLSYQVPASGLPGGIKNVIWSGDFKSDKPGVSMNWQWSASVYKSFSANEAALGVKAFDSSSVDYYANSDHAGTPEVFKKSVTGGARGGGGSNYTGSYSGTGSVTPDLPPSPPPPPPPPPPATGSLSGAVYADANQDGVFNSGDAGIGGVNIELQMFDSGTGQWVTVATDTTDVDGSYSFSDLSEGTYRLIEVSGQPTDTNNGNTSAGTLGGNAQTDPFFGQDQITNIFVGAGQNGTGYDFGETIADAG